MSYKDILIYAKMMKAEFPKCPLCGSEADYRSSGLLTKYVKCMRCGSRWVIYRKHDWRGRDKGIMMCLTKIGKNVSVSAALLSLFRKPIPVSTWKSFAKGEHIEEILGVHEKPTIEKNKVKVEETKAEPVAPRPTFEPISPRVIESRVVEKERVEILWEKIKIIHFLTLFLLTVALAIYLYFTVYLIEGGWYGMLSMVAKGWAIEVFLFVGLFGSLLICKLALLFKIKK